jgi:hypothetical protein
MAPAGFFLRGILPRFTPAGPSMAPAGFSLRGFLPAQIASEAATIQAQ